MDWSNWCFNVIKMFPHLGWILSIARLLYFFISTLNNFSSSVFDNLMLIVAWYRVPLLNRTCFKCSWSFFNSGWVGFSLLVPPSSSNFLFALSSRVACNWITNSFRSLSSSSSSIFSIDYTKIFSIGEVGFSSWNIFYYIFYQTNLIAFQIFIMVFHRFQNIEYNWLFVYSYD